MHRVVVLVTICVFHLSCIYAGRSLAETNLTTALTAADSSEPPCNPGAGPVNNICKLCPRGQYSSTGTCIKCAIGRTTAKEGSTKAPDCSIKCPAAKQFDVTQTLHSTVENTAFNPFSEKNGIVTNMLQLNAVADVGPNVDITVVSKRDDVTALRVTDECANSVYHDQQGRWDYETHGMFYLAVTGPPSTHYTLSVHPTCSYVQEWSSWGTCSATCGNSTRTRTRDATDVSKKAGCRRQVVAEDCSKPACTSSFCETSQWSDWGSLSNTCGVAQQTREREITSEPLNCATPQLKDTRTVNKKPCPTDCIYVQNTEACNASCGTDSYLKYTFKIIEPASEDGTACPKDRSVKCNVPKCQSAVYTNYAFAWIIISLVIFVIACVKCAPKWVPHYIRITNTVHLPF